MPVPTSSLTTVRRLLHSGAALVERTAFHAVMDLPPGVQRLLAGRPVQREGNTLAVDTQLMLRLSQLVGERDPSSLDIAAGRRTMARQAALAGGSQPIGSVRTVETAGGTARLYTPRALGGAIAPLLVFLHGGGFMFGDLDAYDAACRFLAEQSGVRVLSVDYRLAPDHAFPAAYDDALAAFDWAVEHAEELRADPARIGVGGDSAGGNLAAGVALHARERCAFQLLIYPVTTADSEFASRDTFATGFYLTKEFIQVASRHYHPADVRDPRMAVYYAEIPAGVAPAYVATAGFDPLRDEGEAYARRLESAGVPVEMRRFPDQIHGFFNIVGAGHSAKAAATEVAAAVRTHLGVAAGVPG